MESARLERRKVLASRVDSSKLLSCSRILWELRTKIRTGEDQRSALELAVILSMDALSSNKVVSTVSNGHSNAKLTLQQMKQMSV